MPIFVIVFELLKPYNFMQLIQPGFCTFISSFHGQLKIHLSIILSSFKVHDFMR